MQVNSSSCLTFDILNWKEDKVRSFLSVSRKLQLDCWWPGQHQQSASPSRQNKVSVPRCIVNKYLIGPFSLNRRLLDSSGRLSLPKLRPFDLQGRSSTVMRYVTPTHQHFSCLTSEEWGQVETILKSRTCQNNDAIVCTRNDCPL